MGENTLRDLVKEAKANERAFQARVRTVPRGSYSNHYRRMLPSLLAALEFCCNNTAYRPVMAALDLAGYATTEGKVRFYAAGDTVPIGGVAPKAWQDAVVDDRGRTERIPYELCVLVALRDALRRREIYVAGANRWRNPEEDLPGDFEASREVHYAALRQPTEPTEFIAGLQQRMTTALDRFDSALVHVNTLLLQNVLDTPGWAELLGEHDHRALSPLFWSNINPYGRFRLNMDTQLDLATVTSATGQTAVSAEDPPSEPLGWRLAHCPSPRIAVRRCLRGP